MTPLPKRRHSTRRQGKRRAAISLKRPTLVVCPSCKKTTPPHQTCRACGAYKSQTKVKNENVAGPASSKKS